jgi:hypothetical protein
MDVLLDVFVDHQVTYLLTKNQDPKLFESEIVPTPTHTKNGQPPAGLCFGGSDRCQSSSICRRRAKESCWLASPSSFYSFSLVTKSNTLARAPWIDQFRGRATVDRGLLVARPPTALSNHHTTTTTEQNNTTTRRARADVVLGAKKLLEEAQLKIHIISRGRRRAPFLCVVCFCTHARATAD